MTAFMGWIVVVAAGALVMLAALRLTTWILGGPRRPHYPPLWQIEAWPADLRDSWMRHPAHPDRCSCGRYGLPWPDMDALAPGPDPIRHSADRCQPEREVD